MSLSPKLYEYVLGDPWARDILLPYFAMAHTCHTSTFVEGYMKVVLGVSGPFRCKPALKAESQSSKHYTDVGVLKEPVFVRALFWWAPSKTYMKTPNFTPSKPLK